MDLNKRGFAKALEVMARLRAPDGCPWDQEQTLLSMRDALVEANARLRRLAPAHVQVFMKDLRRLAAGTTGELGEEDLERRFTELSRFMDQLRVPSQTGEAVGASTDRDRLLDMVQGREAHLFDRAVDNQISRLRRKIEADSRDPRFIQTVRGGGYRFATDVARLRRADEG